MIAFADSGGEGTPVLVTHGAGLDHAMFDAQATSVLDRGFRVIMWDLRGHGRSVLADRVRFTGSDALHDFDALLTACGVAESVLVGYSWGGNLAQAFACANPQRVTGVIVVDATWNAGLLSGLERMALRLAAPALSVVPAQWLPHLMARLGGGTGVGGQDRGDLLVRGADARTGNISTAMPRWAAAEGVQEYVIADAGHIVTWDAPDQTSQALVEILEGWTDSNMRLGKAL